MVLLAEIPRPSPLPKQFWRCIAIAALLTTVVGSVIVVPRFAAFMAPILVLACWFVARPDTAGRPVCSADVAGIAYVAMAFFLYAFVACLWSPSFVLGVSDVIYPALMCAGLFVLGRQIATHTRHEMLFIAESAWVALAVGALYLLAEALSGQAIKRTLFDAFGVDPGLVTSPRFYRERVDGSVKFAEAVLTRNATALGLLFWPMLLVVWSIFSEERRRFVTLIVAAITAVAIFVLPQETAKLALVASAVVFGLALLSPRLAAILLMAGWAAISLGPVPAAKVASAYKLQNLSWLQYSARHRIFIWNHVADAALETPLLGAGPGTLTFNSRAARENQPRLEKDFKGHRKKTFPRGPPHHAHNFFLQTWRELGLVGAALIAALGVAIVRAIQRLNVNAQPFCFAAFTAISVYLSMAYGMWQTWYLGNIFISIVILLYGVRAYTTRRGAYQLSTNSH